MSVSFCGSVSVNAADPANIENFFDSKTELPVINRFIGNRECPQIGVNPPSCDVNLSFGFFFDGTNNNLDRDLPNRNHSNIARLYLAFPGNDKAAPWPDVKSKYPHYFRTYVPGVGTKFSSVGDTGEGDMKKDGLAFAKRGQNRIIWALVDSINNIHGYYGNPPTK